MSFPAPFDRFEGVVRPEWIDANGHMNLAYYVVLFDSATDAIFETLGIGWNYRHATSNGTFAVETHTLYERELLQGEVVRVCTLVLGHDAKRLHLAHEMRRAVDGRRAAAPGADVPAHRPRRAPRDTLAGGAARGACRCRRRASRSCAAGLDRAADRDARR